MWPLGNNQSNEETEELAEPEKMDWLLENKKQIIYYNQSC